jgi:hypothetical protein
MPHCIVVRKGDFQTFDLLHKAFGVRVPVIWDQRNRSAARQDATPETGERRTGTAPASWVALGFVVIDRP